MDRLDQRRGRARPAPSLRVPRKRYELSEKRPCRRRVQAVVDVRRAARRVTRDGRPGDDVRLGRTGAEEVRAAGVAVAGAAVPGGRVHRDPQPRGVDRVQRPDCAIADVRIVERLPAGAARDGLRAVADRGELLAPREIGQRAGFRQARGCDPLHRAVQHNHCDVVGVALRLVEARVGVPRAPVRLPGGRVVGRVERDRETALAEVAVRRGQEHARRDQRPRAGRPGAVGIGLRREQRPDLRMCGAVGLAVRDGAPGRHKDERRAERDERWNQCAHDPPSPC